MEITFATPKVLTTEPHRCYYLLELEGGRVIAICRGCGKWLPYDEVLRRINK